MARKTTVRKIRPPKLKNRGEGELISVSKPESMVGSVHIRLWKKTLPNLRLLYALTGEPMVMILDRLIYQELLRVNQETGEEIVFEKLPTSTKNGGPGG